MAIDSEDGEYVFLAINKNKKLFSLLYTSDLEYKGEERKYNERELNSIKRDLISKGYKLLKCYN